MTRLSSFFRTSRLLTLATAAVAAGIFAGSAVTPARADGLIVVKADLARPNRNATNHYTYAPLSVISHKVKVSVLGQLAVTEIEQEFYNDSDDQLEGEYIFPVPDGADIEKFSMDVNGVQTKADVIDKDAASQVYESIVRPPVGNGRDPALMEYVGRGMFKCRIFPLEPHKSKTVKISYSQMLKQKDGLLDYHYTLDTTKYSRKPIKNLSLAFTVDGKEPLTTLYSPTHMVDIKRDEAGGGNKASISYRAEDIRPRNDFHLFIGRKATPVGLTALTYRPKGQDEGYFVLMASPTVDKTNVNLPKDVVFIVDTSGSMAGPKIRQARQALNTCINSLKPNDRFDIVRFSTEVEPAFKTLQPVSDDSRAKATAFIRSLAADGETALEPALKQALAERATGKDEDPNRLFMIVFLTDGEPTHGETNPDKIVAEYVSNAKAANVRLFTFGIGSEVNTRLLDDLALNSHGSSNYVLENEDISQAVGTFFTKIQDPVLTNLKLTTENATIANLYPNAMPDMFVGDQIVVMGKYTKPGTFPVTLSGKSASGKELSFSDQLAFADSTDASNAWIGKLWATRRVGSLLDQMRAGGREDLKSEVYFLAKKFGIVTPHTAMIIVEQNQRARLPLAYHLLGDLENDPAALLRTTSFFSALTAGKSVGDSALTTSINTNSYRDVTSLEQLSRVVEQRESRLHDRTGADKGAMATLTKTRPELQVDWNQPGAREQYEKQLKELMETGARVYDNYAAQNQMVGDRTFFLTGDRWIDSSLAVPTAATKLEKIRFCSDAYFQLVRTHREAAPIIALGKNVTFEMAGTIYEISE